MEPRLDLVTVRVDDVDAAARYYVEGLGWQPLLVVPGEVAFFQVGPGRVLSLFDAAGFDADAAGHAATVTLAHNVDSAEHVDEVVAQMVDAGATVLKGPVRAEWGGYHATILDPAGAVWEVAHNPGWSVDPDGTVHLGPA